MGLAGWTTKAVPTVEIARLRDVASVPARPDNTEAALALAMPRSLDFLGHDWRVLNAPLAVAFGGTLSPSTDAHQLTILLAQAVVENVGGIPAMVVSGGGRGVDTAAHFGALDVGGQTVAVLANPVTHGLHPYIPRRSLLERSILAHRGGFVSEYADFLDDYLERAKARGRIITALSDLMIAMECSSGSVTVTLAMQASTQGRTVLAIDWSRFKKLHHPPKKTGFQELMSRGIAQAFPTHRVSGITDPLLREEFMEKLSGLGSRVT